MYEVNLAYLLERERCFKTKETISRDRIFADGYTLFAFDITPNCCDGPHFNLVHKGNMRVEMHFDDQLEQTVNVIVYGEFESVLGINRNRNVVYDY